MLRVVPSEVSVPRLHQFLLGCVAPRPIAFASTVDADGNPNLSPFSFFNVMGSNPPVLVFSPSRSGRDNKTKHTLDNIAETGEVVINIVTYAMVQQMSLASAPFAKGVNEFMKSGFTPLASERVKPWRVQESPAHLECKMRDIIRTGDQGSAGNIVICDVLLMHISESVLVEDNKISPYKFDQVARMGGDYYCRVIPEAIFSLPQPRECGIGVEALPENVRNSKVFTGNNLGQLGNITQLPTKEATEAYVHAGFPDALRSVSADAGAVHRFIKERLDAGMDPSEALQMLMAFEYGLV